MFQFLRALPLRKWQMISAGVIITVVIAVAAAAAFATNDNKAAVATTPTPAKQSTKEVKSATAETTPAPVPQLTPPPQAPPAPTPKKPSAAPIARTNTPLPVATVVPFPTSPQPATPPPPPTPSEPSEPFGCYVDAPENMVLAPGAVTDVFTLSTSDGSSVTWYPYYKNVIWADGTNESPSADWWMVVRHNAGPHVGPTMAFAIQVSPTAAATDWAEVAGFVQDDARGIYMACTIQFAIKG